MGLSRRTPMLWLAWCALVVGTVAAAFWLPALRATGGRWPAPLDDVYIYFGFARSAALGHPFCWQPGSGYSSGATSMLYPLLLAPAWAVGLRGSALGWAAAALALVSLVDLCRSLRALTGGGRASVLIPPLVMAVPLLDWSWLSGMECALAAALLGRSLRACGRALGVSADRRARAQLALGGWLALLVLTRPETAPCAAALTVAAAHGARSLRTVTSLARAGGPAALGLGAQAAINLALTGEAMPAGAVRKLLWSVPYTSGARVALEMLKNAVVLLDQAFIRALGGWPACLAATALAVVALASGRHRRIGAALWVGMVGGLLMVCTNATARFQNYRYAAPLLTMLLAAAALGMAALRRRRRHRQRLVGLLLAVVAVLAPAGQLRRQISHFARASANILEQQGEVARRLAARRPAPRRVLVNDAGVIPYLSELPALDGLGLGGLHALPFARASVQGPAAVVEIIEHLPAADRPDLMAIYPGWWGSVADRFGRRLDGVRISDNVICAADEKVIYAADWSALAPAGQRRTGQLDELDVADVLSERGHAYTVTPPHSGWLISAVHRLPASSRRRFDAGRIVPAGGSESFVVGEAAAPGPATLRLRTDRAPAAGGCRIELELQRSGRLVGRLLPEVANAGAEQWVELTAPLPHVEAGDTLVVHAVRCPWRSYHLWLQR